MRTGIIRAAVLLAGVATLAACEQRDPYYRTDVWQPTGANAANIAAMVADPHDLIQGRGTSRGSVQPSMIAVDRVMQDQPRPIDPMQAAPKAQGDGGGSSGGGSAGGSGGGSGGDNGLGGLGGLGGSSGS